MITLRLRNGSEKEHTAEKCEEHEDVQSNPFNPLFQDLLVFM